MAKQKDRMQKYKAEPQALMLGGSIPGGLETGTLSFFETSRTVTESRQPSDSHDKDQVKGEC